MPGFASGDPHDRFGKRKGPPPTFALLTMLPPKFGGIGTSQNSNEGLSWRVEV